ncbi:ABC transporter permease [Clostridia bacterium]|nr:ABC transporter permease [Clostridia bacterium]
MEILTAIAKFIAADLRTATPLILAGIGLVFSARAGLVNIGVEGMMLVGALSAVAGSWWFGSAMLGTLFAMFTASIIALIFAYLSVTVKADQIVVGTAINILGLGLTTTLARTLFGLNTAPPDVASFEIIAIPGLSKIPFFGQAFFQQNALVYLALILVPIASFIMFKTDIGLKVRAVGEHPKACDTVGINVYLVRYVTILISGLFSGLAGAYVSLGLLSFFTENMIAGRGFMVLAAVVFGKYTPRGVLFAGIIFGAAEAIQFRLQAAGTAIPFQFLLMLPYALTIFALAGFVGKSRGPAAMSKPYDKD